MNQELLKDWQYEVQNGDTVLGFSGLAAAQRRGKDFA